mmetsp:Transcript_29859/g.45614  ORF Transcript_29859/g.45614 Transcript_29859/m.45614 type:complete len:115 (+) Transcript_29859:2314-2658(+)
MVLASFFALKFKNDLFTWLGVIFIIGWALFYLRFSRLLEIESENDYGSKLAKALNQLNKEDLAFAEKLSLNDEQTKQLMYGHNVERLRNSYIHPFFQTKQSTPGNEENFYSGAN